MFSRGTTKKIVLIITIITTIGLIVGLVKTTQSYNSALNEVNDLDSSTHFEIVRTTASDGTPLKALLMVRDVDYIKIDQSVPLIVGCHGMSGNFWQMGSYYYSLVQRGYAVISPEFRGHTSNPAPITLGSKEPWDVIQIVNYLEENYDFVNTSKSGIIGTSMGGLYATGAYYFESQGQNRFKALVNLCGPTNVSREIAFYTPHPELVGDISFVNNVSGKNPVEYIPIGGLSNVYMAHGTNDDTVDYQCSVDLYNVLDPTDSRDDIEFVSLEGYGHGINTASIMKNSTVWLDKYVLGVTTDPDDVALLSVGFSNRPWNNFIMYLLISCIAAIPLVISVIYMIKPSLFEQSQSEERDKDSNEEEISKNKKQTNQTISVPNNPKSKIFYIGTYLGVNFIAGAIALLIDTYIVSELMLTSAFSLGFIIIIYRKAPEYLKNQAKNWLNWRSMLICTIVTSVFITIYSVIPSLDTIENAVLYPGIRITWWIPYFTTYIAIQMVCNILFIRFVFADMIVQKKNIKLRFLEPILNGLLMGGIGLLFWFWAWYGVLLVPMLNISFHIIPLGGLGLLVAFAVFDGISQILEITVKNLVSGGLMLGLIISMFVAANWLIFFY